MRAEAAWRQRLGKWHTAGRVPSKPLELGRLDLSAVLSELPSDGGECQLDGFAPGLLPPGDPLVRPPRSLGLAQRIISTWAAGLNVMICCPIASYTDTRSVAVTPWRVAGPVTRRNTGIASNQCLYDRQQRQSLPASCRNRDEESWRLFLPSVSRRLPAKLQQWGDPGRTPTWPDFWL